MIKGGTVASTLVQSLGWTTCLSVRRIPVLPVFTWVLSGFFLPQTCSQADRSVCELRPYAQVQL